MNSRALEEAAPYLLPLTILSPTMISEEYRFPLAVVVSAVNNNMSINEQ
jgi:hypothetical protein